MIIRRTILSNATVSLQNQRTESPLLKKRQLFSKDHIHVVNESVAMAEELVSEYYKMSASEWLQPKFDVKTRVDLSSEEIVTGPFAQVVRYEGQLKDASLGSSSYDFYKICLQDHEILAALAKFQRLKLLPFTLYILTHELIHIVRFSKFLQSFNAKPEERMAEESRVHELTHDILCQVSIDGLTDVLKFYIQWREPMGGDDISFKQ
jgi:hypothetical protein